MHVVVAPDAFAGSLSAAEAAAAISAGWLRRAPHDTVRTVPLSDGGPGFLDVIAAARPAASLLPVTVADPLGRPTPAAVLLDGEVAFLESAQACGLHLLGPGERDPERTTTTGVGQLLAAAVQTGASRVVIGLGGSGTYDGGRGAVEHLDRVWPGSISLLVATDSDVPLDDARYFAEEQGAAPGRVDVLAARAAGWADELEGATGRRVRAAAGSGAAGGLGFGLLALGGSRVPGIGLVADLTDLRQLLADADLVVTGTGRYEATSLRGGVCGGVARLAQQAGRACVVLAGEVVVGGREARAHGIDELRSLTGLTGSREAALRRPAERLAELAAGTAGQWSPRARTLE